MLFIILFLRLSLASSGSENDGVTGICAGSRGGAGLGGGGGVGGSGNTGGGGTGGGTPLQTDIRVRRVTFLGTRGPLPNLSSTNLLTTSVCSSRSRLISCTLTVVSRGGTGLIGDTEPELRVTETDSSKLRVGESVLRDVDRLKVSLADRQMAGEYSRIELAPETDASVDGGSDMFENMLFVLLVGVSGTSGGEKSSKDSDSVVVLFVKACDGGDTSVMLSDSMLGSRPFSSSLLSDVTSVILSSLSLLLVSLVLSVTLVSLEDLLVFSFSSF